MLDPESEQIREVFAVFGSAMYLAQNLERELAILLAVSSESKPMTAWDYDARFAEYFQSTFGALVTKFAELASPAHLDLLERLEMAADDRNELAHHYFWDRAAQFCSSEGRAQMIEELVSLGNRFEALDAKLDELSGEMMQARGLSKEMLQINTETELKELLSGASEPYRPQRVPNPTEIVSAYEWRANSVTKCALVLASNDGKFLLLGERGLCYGPQDVPVNELILKTDFVKALPATVNPRPKRSAPWDYGIVLANGYILRARSDTVNGKHVCRFGLRKATR
jgi:hypothetical protein